MRGKLVEMPQVGRGRRKASMRPAHYAREIGRPAAGEPSPPPASMRPAHYAREIEWIHGSVPVMVALQ